MLAGEERRRKAMLQGALSSAVESNPDQVAAQRKAAAQLNLPPAVGEWMPSLQNDAKVQQVQRDVAGSPALQRRFSDADYAKLAHDDSGLLSTLMNSLRRGVPGAIGNMSAIGAASTGRFLGNLDEIERKLAKGEEILQSEDPMGLRFATPEVRSRVRSARVGLLQSQVGSVQAAADTRNDYPQPDVVRAISQEKTFRGAVERFLEDPVTAIAAVGPESLVQSLPGIVGGILAGGGAGGAAAMGTGSFLTDYGSQLLAGLQEAKIDVNDPEALTKAFQDKTLMSKIAAAAFAHGAGVGVVDGLSGGLASKMMLPARTAAGSPVARELANIGIQIPVQGAFGGFGEILGSTLAGQEINPGDVLFEIIGEGFGAPAEVVAIGGREIANRVAAHYNNARRMGEEVADANANAKGLADLFAKIAESKSRPRDAATFASVVQELADETDGAPKALFIDAETLRDTLADSPEALDVFNQMSQTVKDQLAAGDSTIEIPIGDLTHAAGTALEKALVPNLRARPDSLSQAEANEQLSGMEQTFMKAAEAAVNEASDIVAMRASADVVKANVLGQLNATKRFRPEVNESYASLAGAFYTTMAGRMGTTPEEMFARYPLRITSKLNGADGVFKDSSTRPGEMTVEGYHFSMADRPVLSTGYFGRGLKGSGREEILNAADDRIKQRLSFYFDKGTGTRPGAGVGGRAHRVQLTGVYDADADPLKLKGGDARAFESKVLDAGFRGYATRMDGSQPGQVIMLGAQTFTPELLGAQSRIDTGQRVEPLPRQAPQWETRDRGTPEAMQALMERRQANPSWAGYDMQVVGGELQVRKKDGVLEQQGPRVEPAVETDLDRSSSLDAARVSPRNPTGARATESGLSGERLQPTIAAMPDAMVEKTAAEFLKYPNFAGLIGTPREILEQAKVHMKDNLRALMNAFPDDLYARARMWYVGGNRIARALSEEYGVPVENIALAMAALSPQKNWFENVTAGERVIDTVVRHSQEPWSPEMTAVANARGWFEDPKISKYVSNAEGRTLREMYDPGDTESFVRMAWWVRAYDEAHNPRTLSVITPEGTFIDKQFSARADGAPTPLRWGSAGEISKAIAALVARTPEARSNIAGGAHKVRSFFNNIAAPYATGGDVTIDTHAVAAALLRPLGGTTHEVQNVLSGGVSKDDAALGFAGIGKSVITGSVGAYGVYADAYRELAAEFEMLPREVQSITWEAVRLLFDAKGAALKAATSETWNRFSRGEITHDQATATILGLAGGIGRPDWASEQPTPQPAGSSYRQLPAADGRGSDPTAGDLNDTLQQTGDRAGRYSSGSLAPLPGAPAVAGAAGPDPRLVAVAEQYARERGIDLRRQASYAVVDPERAARIAAAYEAMPHAPNDPAVKEAYADLLRQTTEQYLALQAAGYKFWFMDPANDPYQGNPWNAMRDLRANQSMAVFPTEAGFGTGGQVNIGLADPNGGPNLDPAVVLEALRVVGAEVETSAVFSSDTEPTLVVKVKRALTKEQGDFLSGLADQEAIAQRTADEKGSLFGPMAEKWGPFNPTYFVTPTGARGDEVANPLMADTGITWPYGSPDGEQRPVLANDLFRAVHDAFGHGLEGAGFRAQGEENAWQAHVRLFTGPAVGAITSETRGQNSWLNYGPYGEANQTAKVEDTVFADQKTGLMPEWTWAEGRVADEGTSGADELAQEQPAPRGTFSPSKLEITLLEDANLSTFLHELGHFFLEVQADLASQPGAPQQIVDDFATTLKWFGVKAEDWAKMDLEGRRPHHERWAESFEQYLFEGKAPSVEMRGVFQRFREFMISAYKSLKAFMAGRGLKVSDEVRGVFDRLIATDEQIAEAQSLANFEAVFKSAKEAGMTPEEWTAYQEQNAAATTDATEDLQKKSLADMKWAAAARGKALRKAQAEVKEKRDAMRAEVKAEVEALPIEQARAYIKALRVSTPEQKDALKDWGDRRAAALERAQEEVKAALLAGPEAAELKGIKKGQFLAKNKKLLDNQAEAKVIAWEQENPRPTPVLPEPQMETIAEQFGFTSGDELARALVEQPPAAQFIDALTEQRLLETYGELVTADGMARAANEAVHNEARRRFVATELAAMQRAMSATAPTGKTDRKGRPLGVNVIVQAAKSFAETVVNRRRILELKPAQHAAAATRAAARAAKLQAEGKTADAIGAKRDQLLSEYTARYTTDAAAEVERGLAYLRKFDKASVREKLPADYVDQIDQMLERFELKTSTTARELDRRANLAAWVAQQQEMGLDPVVPEDLLANTRLTSYKQMTVEEFRGLVDGVKNVEHLARLKSKLLAAKDKREFDAIAEEITASIIEHGGKPREVQLEPDGKIKKFFKGAWADHRKLNSLIRQMDGGKDNGPFYRALVRSMNDAGARENTMLEQATEALAKIYAPIEALPGGFTGAKLFIPEINNSLSRGGRLSIALNWGNPQNRQRVMDGDGWTEAQVNAILRTLTPTELKFVNDVWAHLDSYWPEIKAKQERVSGVVEDKVEAVPFELNGVQMRGGYYPIKYDTERSIKAEKQEALETARQIMQGAVARPTTRRGHTKARVDEVKGRPVLKDLRAITQHVNQVVHDLAWHEWFIDANRLLNDKRIASAIRQYHGNDTARVLKEAADAIAVGDTVHQGQIDRLLLKMRSNVTRSIMGASLTTALLQPFGLTQSMARIGVVPVLKGAARWAGDAARMESTVGWINEKSEFMRLRSKTFNRELREISERVQGKSKFLQVYDASLFMLMQKLQMVADVPTWVGAYEKALAGGVDESAAVALADEAVLGSQGGGTTKDLSAVQRNMPFLTQFYSYFNTTLNLVVEQTATTDFKNPKAVAGWMGDMALLAVIPAILPALLTHLLKGGGEDDEPEDWAKKMLEWQAGYLFGMFVGLREVPTLWSPFDYAGPPAAKVLSDGKKMAQQAGQGEIDDPAVLATISLLGTVFGIPTVQIIRSYKGWQAWSDGDAPPSSILFGPPPRD